MFLYIRYSTFVLSHVSGTTLNAQKVCILQYCDYLIKMFKMSYKEIEKHGSPLPLSILLSTNAL